MTIEELKALDWARAAKFYSEHPDGQWDTEASLACRLMPGLLALAEACNAANFDSYTEDEGTIGSSSIETALATLNAELEAL